MTQGYEIETVAGPDGPRLTKRATNADACARLRRETDRLHQARHPGVVEVVEHTDSHIVFAWAGGQTLATFRPPVAVAAAILAATAATVADLHDLRIVHGRLDPSHVVIGSDGRPRLCGMAGLDPSATPPTEADDVAALGRLIEGLIGVETEEEPIPERRWNRRRLGSFQRRALQTLADQATAHDPAQRPTARVLATAIAEAVPEARLQTPRPSPSRVGGRHLRQPPRRKVPVPVVVAAVALTATVTITTAAFRVNAGLTPGAPVPARSTTSQTNSSTTPSPVTPSTVAAEHYALYGNSILVDGRTYTVGRQGDRVAVGDWDCNGTMTPGLVRPSTGEIFLFASWAGIGAGVTIAPTAVVAGARSLRPQTTGSPCAAPLVESSDGTTRPLPIGTSK